ncbi:uncharacterized protein LOC114274351 [Camellia sinensis]|uniref:uncharacterized protein LOC114274351 n=1 Tax=Camellia sinensis TaxID=4442 RepID=UPI00103554BC|nr:uncharacterized protein LOC114274351 [Camellia sinensis]
MVITGDNRVAKYTSDFLAHVGLTDCKTGTTPVDPQTCLTPLDDHLFQFMVALRSSHYATLVRILCYLKGTMLHSLHYSAYSSLQLHAFFDVDWARDSTDCHSTTGFYFFLDKSLIAWRSKKRTLIARSSTEVEYHALANTTQELV